MPRFLAVHAAAFSEEQLKQLASRKAPPGHHVEPGLLCAGQQQGLLRVGRAEQGGRRAGPPSQCHPLRRYLRGEPFRPWPGRVRPSLRFGRPRSRSRPSSCRGASIGEPTNKKPGKAEVALLRQRLLAQSRPCRTHSEWERWRRRWPTRAVYGPKMGLDPVWGGCLGRIGYGGHSKNAFAGSAQRHLQRPDCHSHLRLGAWLLGHE